MPKKTKLDPHRDELIRWTDAAPEGEGLTLAAAVARLQSQHSLSVSAAFLSKFLERQRRRRAVDDLMTRVATGSQRSAALKEQFGESPPPELATLIHLLQLVVFELTVKGSSDETVMGMVTALSGRILDFEKINVKRDELAAKKRADEQDLEHRRQALQLEREKFAARFCEIIRQALTDARARELAETNAPNSELIAHMRQTYFSDIDALAASGAVQLPQ